jgi:hypothetical protein
LNIFTTHPFIKTNFTIRTNGTFGFAPNFEDNLATKPKEPFSAIALLLLL